MKKYFAIALAAVLAVSMLAGCGGGKSKSKFDDELKSYEALMNGDLSDLEAMAPEAFWDWLEDKYKENTGKKIDIEDYQDMVEDTLDDLLDEMEDEVGKNVEISMEIQKEEEMDEDYVESLGEFLEEKYDIDEKDVTQAYELKIKVIAEGKKGDDSSKEYITMAEIDGQWYSLRVEERKGEVVSASFVIEAIKG